MKKSEERGAEFVRLGLSPYFVRTLKWRGIETDHIGGGPGHETHSV
jgi:hypothetical protein